jgi:hypothetical protein
VEGESTGLGADLSVSCNSPGPGCETGWGLSYETREGCFEVLVLKDRGHLGTFASKKEGELVERGG